MDPLSTALKPLRKKIIFKQTSNIFITSISIGMGACSILFLSSKLIWIPFLPFIAAAILLCSLFCGALIGVIKRPSILKVAQIGDSLGFKERFVTALECTNSNFSLSNPADNINSLSGEVQSLVIDDAIRQASRADFNQLFSSFPTKSRIYSCLILMICTFVIGFFPGPHEDQFMLKQQFRNQLEKEIQTVQQMRKNLESIPSNTAEAKKELNQLIKELKKASSEGEAIRALHQTQEQLKKISSNAISKDLKNLGVQLSKHDATRQLGETLQKGNLKDLDAQIQKLNNNLKTASKSERETFSETFKQAALALAENPELSQTLTEVSNALSQSNSETLQKSMNQLEQHLTQLASENAELRKALETMSQSLTQLTQNTQSEKDAAQSDTPSNQTTANQNTQSSENLGANNAKQTNPSTNPGNSNGVTPGQGHIDSENIFTRQAESMPDTQLNLEGPPNPTGHTTEQEVRSMGPAGESVPYRQVIQAYQSQALKNLNNDDIPYNMKELIRDYFSALE